MKELFDDMMKNEITPFLKNYGYKKVKQYFYKTVDDLIFIIHFNLSSRNGWGHTKFYIYGEIYSKEIDRIMGKSGLSEPKNDEPHYNLKDDCFPKTGYDIEEGTDIRKIALEIKNGLEHEERFYKTIKTTNDLMELMILENYLHKYMEIFTYLLLKDKNKKLEEYLKRLYDKFGKENRWKIFEENMNKILLEKSINKNIMEIIK
ncbi:MAG: DUF4304 domain-containing protein [Spirochaetaceae bacterium]|jgi:hypothetical protein|nr:DUF4304 domain-containing protein [Spirochaetaceae bacterium]